MKFFIRFSARKIGALGIWQTFTEVVEAADKDAALLKLYEKYEHISIIGIQEVPADFRAHV